MNKLWAVNFSLFWLTQSQCGAAFSLSTSWNTVLVPSKRPFSRLHYTNQIPDTSSSSSDPYSILNLPRGIISHQAIQRAYNELAKKYHPSHRLSPSTTPEEKERIELEFQRIHSAYEFLINRKTIDAGAAADGIGRVKVKVGMNGDSYISTATSSRSIRSRSNYRVGGSQTSEHHSHGDLYESPPKRKRKHISYEEWDTWVPEEDHDDENSWTTLKEYTIATSDTTSSTLPQHEQTMEDFMETDTTSTPLLPLLDPSHVSMTNHPTTSIQNDIPDPSIEPADRRIEPMPQPIIHTHDTLQSHNHDERTTVVLTEFLNKLHTLKTHPKSSSKYIHKIHTVNADGTLVPLELGSHVQDFAQDIASLEQQVLEMEHLVNDLNDLQILNSVVENKNEPSSIDTEDTHSPKDMAPKKQGQKVKVNKALELLSRNGMSNTTTRRRVQRESSPTSPKKSPSKTTVTVLSDGPRLPNSNIRHLKDEFESVKRHLEESKMAIRIQVEELEKDKSKFASLEKEVEEREKFIREHSHAYTTHFKNAPPRQAAQDERKSLNSDNNSRLDLGGPSTTMSSSKTMNSNMTAPAAQVLNGKAMEYAAAKDLNNRLNRLLREKRKQVSGHTDKNLETQSSSTKQLKNGFSFYPLISNTDTNFKMLFLAHMFAHAMKKSKDASNDAAITVSNVSPKPTARDIDHRPEYSKRSLLNLELQKLIIQHMYAQLAQIRLTLKKGNMLLKQAQLPPVIAEAPAVSTSTDQGPETTIKVEVNMPKMPVLPPKPSFKAPSTASVEADQSMNILQLLPDTTDPFAILNLKQGEVNLAVIKRAYRQMAKLCHPDKRMYINSSSKQRQIANEEFAKVNAAYAYLIGKTETYDIPGKSTKDTHDTPVQKSKDDFYNFYRKPNGHPQHHNYSASHNFKKGDFVNIISGPHTDSHGTIMSIYPNMLKVEVNLSMSVFCMLHEVELDKSWKRQREREQRQTAS